VHTTGETRAGRLEDLTATGRLLTKVGSHPVVVFWHEGRAYAIEDRCPHLGLPLHRWFSSPVSGTARSAPPRRVRAYRGGARFA
jgi:nitrite reductase/ring-hydroxylating ferredoxin subunit